MTLIRQDLTFDVTAALPAGSAERAMLSATIVADPEALPERPVVILAVPGGTYHRRYWDLQPPGRDGYSKAAYLAERGSSSSPRITSAAVTAAGRPTATSSASRCRRTSPTRFTSRSGNGSAMAR